MITNNRYIDVILSELDKVDTITREKFNNISHQQLNWKPDSNSWSVGECFEHLMRTNSHYLRFYKNAVDSKPANDQGELPFKHSILGKLVIKAVNPNFRIKTKTAKSFNPFSSSLDEDTVEKFLRQNREIKELVSKLKGLNLRKIRVTSPFNKNVRYSLGDSLTIIAYHDLRHIGQAERVTKTDGFPS